MGRVILACVLLFSGCAARERIVYQDVLIPTKCEIATPIRPKSQADTVLMMIDLIDYTRALEIALRACQ